MNPFADNDIMEDPTPPPRLPLEHHKMMHHNVPPPPPPPAVNTSESETTSSRGTSGSSPASDGQHQQAVSQPTAEEARKRWREYGEHNSQALENRRAALRAGSGSSSRSGGGGGGGGGGGTDILSVRVISAEDRVDPAGSYYTAYLMEVEAASSFGGGGPQPPRRHVVEHRYSEFARLHSELVANKVHMRSSFPHKSLAGRLGNWTPAQHWAPDKMAELVTYRKIKLDIWLVELAELMARGTGSGGGGGGGSGVPGGIPNLELRDMVQEFFQRSAAGCPPCDRANPVSWDGIAGGTGGNNMASSNSDVASVSGSSVTTASTARSPSSSRHASGSEKILSNPVSFTLGSEIRKATYTVGHMCGGSSLSADRSIPLDLLHQAKGLCFLTVLKVGCVISGRVGTGLIIARTKDGGWSPPSAIGTVGLGYGALIGGDITSYLIILNTERAVRSLARKGSVTLGGELGVAVGPVGRSATGNLNASNGGVAPAYSYAHSKGFFVGISLEGSVVACRSDVNAKFYGRPVDPNMLLFESHTTTNGWRPRAAQPLYDALDEALSAQIVGWRPSQMGMAGVGPVIQGGGPPQMIGAGSGASEAVVDRPQSSPSMTGTGHVAGKDVRTSANMS